MASTYENDLRLEEMATGENSGSWGTKTNTNLELVADAFSYGTEIIADADTAITIPDGAADAARSLALKINSSEDLTTTRVVTLGPNTTSKVWIIENNTSGDQTLTISAGSGSNITLLNGQTKIIATDGIGAGSNVVELTQDIAIADLFIDDDLSLQSDGAIINFGADADITLTHAADTSLTLGGAGSTTGLVVNNTATDGDPFLSFALSGTQTFTMGVDDGDSDKFKIGTSAIGTSTRLTIASNGDIAFYDDGGSSEGFLFDASDSTVTITNYDTGASFAPDLILFRDSASPLADDSMGQILFRGRDSGGATNDYIRLQGILEDPTATAEDGRFTLAVLTAGTNRNRLSIDSSELVINENAIETDFRVETPDNQNAIYLDGVNETVGFFTTSNTGKFNISGESASGYVMNITSGANYQGWYISGDSTFGNGTMTLLPNTIPGSGTAEFYTHFSDRTAVSAGTSNHSVVIDNGLNVNYAQTNHNTIIQSVDSSTMFVVDADVNRIGINTSSPAAFLLPEVSGYLDSGITIYGGTTGSGSTNDSTLLSLYSDSATTLYMRGGSTGYVNSAIVMESSQGTNQRGLGTFMFDPGGDNEWYVGRPYSASDKFVINRRATAAHADEVAYLNVANGGTNYFKIDNNASEVVFNEDAQAYDFRVEGEGDNTALFVDSTYSNIGLGTSSPSGTFKLDSVGNIRVRGTAGTIRLEADDASVIADQLIGKVDFYANDTSSGGTGTAGFIEVRGLDQYGVNTYMDFGIRYSGGGADALKRLRLERFGQFTTFPVDSGDFNHNANNADANFVVRSQSSDNAIFVDAALERVNIWANAGENNFNVNAQGTSSHSSGTMPPGITLYSNGSGDGTGNAIMWKNSVGAQGLAGIGSFRTGANGGYGRDLRFYTNNTVATNAYKERMRIGENGAIYGPQAYNGGFITAEISQSHAGSDSSGTADITFTVKLKNTSGTYDNWQLMMYLTTSGNSSPAKTSVYEIRGSQRSSAGSVNRTTLVSGESRTITSSVSGLTVTFTIASEGSSTATQGAKFCWVGGSYGCEQVYVDDSA